MCLAIYGGDQTGNKAGGKAVQGNCGSSIDQEWHTVQLNAPGDPAGDEVLLIDQAGHCLGIPGNSTTQGVQADAEVCLNQNHSVPGQVWIEF